VETLDQTNADPPGTEAATVIIYVVYVPVSSQASAVAENAFFWSGTIGTLILLVVYVLATIGMTRLVWTVATGS
jgi:nitrogen fixation-related uncharacterized protein